MTKQQIVSCVNKSWKKAAPSKQITVKVANEPNNDKSEMSKSDGNFVETDSMDIPNFLDKKDNTTAIIKTKPASSDIRDLNNFDLWRLHSSEYYWWHKQII